MVRREMRHPIFAASNQMHIYRSFHYLKQSGVGDEPGDCVCRIARTLVILKLFSRCLVIFNYLFETLPRRILALAHR